MNINFIDLEYLGPRLKFIVLTTAGGEDRIPNQVFSKVNQMTVVSEMKLRQWPIYKQCGSTCCSSSIYIIVPIVTFLDIFSFNVSLIRSHIQGGRTKVNTKWIGYKFKC